MPELIEPFRWLESEPSRCSSLEPGFGLGLPIVHAIVKSQRGKVQASSRSGGGQMITCAAGPGHR